ncbi:MAG: carboxypeptidase regulatory-like domain-containing protein [Balneola sp.]
MKFFLLFISIVFISCQEENPSNVTVDEPVDSITVQGKVFDVYMNDTLLTNGATVTIDDFTFETNESGEFSFKLEPGDYQIEIDSPNHLSFTDSITANIDKNYDLELSPVYLDLMPLKQGISWRYSYFYEDLLAPVDVITTGEVSYSISSISVNNTDSVYTVVEKLNLEKVVYSSQFENRNLDNDTTIISSVNEFHIIQDLDNLLTSNGSETPFSTAFNDYVGFDFDTRRLLRFKRYIPKSRTTDESLVITKNPLKGGGYLLEKDIGIKTYSYSDRDGLWSRMLLMSDQ